MFKTAFSTVACPDWTLDQIARCAADWGYDGVELRTFGPASTEFACDPALTAAEKVRRILGQAGVEAAVVGSSVGFGEPIRPALIGRAISDTERTVREAKLAIDLAAAIECPLVRVFGFEFPRTEKRKSGLRRIAERLGQVADAARHTGVKIVVENGGSFCAAEDLADLLAEVKSDLVGAEYSIAVGAVAGDEADEAVRVLGDRLWVYKLKDRNKDHLPCPIGQGGIPCRAAVAALARAEFSGWVVVEWDRAWIPGLAGAETVLPEAIKRVYEWAGQMAGRGVTV
jgi:sugar phosphate isomerase/epimerase